MTGLAPSTLEREAPGGATVQRFDVGEHGRAVAAESALVVVADRGPGNGQGLGEVGVDRRAADRVVPLSARAGGRRRRRGTRSGRSLPESSWPRRTPLANTRGPHPSLTASPSSGKSSSAAASPASARIALGSASAANVLPALAMVSDRTVPARMIPAAARTASTSPASARARSRRRARSSAGTSSSSAGPVPSAFARSEPVARGKRSPTSSPRNEIVSALASRATSATMRVAPRSSLPAPRAKTSRGDEASMAASKSSIPGRTSGPDNRARRTVAVPVTPVTSFRAGRGRSSDASHG